MSKIQPSLDRYKRGYMTSVELIHPHFQDTEWDYESLIVPTLIWAYTPEEAEEIARQTLVPPHLDPALINVRVTRYV